MKILFIYIFLFTFVVAQENALIRYDSSCSGIAPLLASEKPQTAWIYETDESIKSTALIANGFVYTSTTSGQVLCIELSTGKKLWSFKSEAPFTSSPSLIHDKIYIGDEYGICYCLDSSTGKKLWEFACEDKIVGAVNFYKDKIIFGAFDHYLYCLNSKGELEWKFETDAPINGMCCIVENIGIVAGCDGLIRFINLDTGKESTHFDGKSYFAASPVCYNNTVAVGSLNGDYYALTFPEAKLLWEITSEQKKGECYASAVITKDIVVFPSKKKNIFAVNIKNGKEIWKYTTKSRVETSIIITGDKIVFNEFSGKVHFISISTGTSNWLYETGSRISSSPAIGEGYLIITCEDGSIHALF